MCYLLCLIQKRFFCKINRMLEKYSNFLLYLLRKCFYCKRRDEWIAEGFWEYVAPYLITAKMLKRYANKIDSTDLLILLKLNVPNTQVKINTLYKASDLKRKEFLLSLLAIRNPVKNRVYPSFELIEEQRELIEEQCLTNSFIDKW